MNKNQFRKIVDNYIGKIVEELDQIHIENINEICSYFESGEIHTKKKVLCKIGIRNGKLFGEEATLSIIGGFSNFSADEDSVASALQKFGFRKKTVQQQSLFDLLRGGK